MIPRRDAEKLVEELYHNAKASGGRPLERRLADLTLWFYRNKNRIAPDNLRTRIELLEKTVWIQMEIMALLLERNHELEAAKRGMSSLWLPASMSMNDGDGNTQEFR